MGSDNCTDQRMAPVWQGCRERRLLARWRSSEVREEVLQELQELVDVFHVGAEDAG